MRAIPLAFVILTLVRASEGQGLLVNPSFESGCSGNFATLGAGSTAIPGWTVIGEVDWICTLWQPGDRVRSVDLNGCFAGGVSQAFSTIPNQRYSVAFQLSGNPGNPWPVQGPAVKVMQVSAAGTSATFSFDTTGRSFSNMGWQTNFWSFVATSSNTTLAFQSLTSGCQGPAIDFVHVTAGFDFTIVQPHPA